MAMVRLRDGAELWTTVSGTGPARHSRSRRPSKTWTRSGRPSALASGRLPGTHGAPSSRSATPRGIKTTAPPSPKSLAWAQATASGKPTSPNRAAVSARNVNV